MMHRRVISNPPLAPSPAWWSQFNHPPTSLLSGNVSFTSPKWSSLRICGVRSAAAVCGGLSPDKRLPAWHACLLYGKYEHLCLPALPVRETGRNTNGPRFFRCPSDSMTRTMVFSSTSILGTWGQSPEKTFFSASNGSSFHLSA